ncbi:hypothetical protein E8E13_006615 [Curvularia kusanoi]|uniref:Uncharacterized protein n=1 Tax=Curvularia kusanoi TaxID=90978 RepID=A0A9P4W813_CURKU|nr:hypothetical protein E8E13_006615 [Curvularia kusanoi]
MYSQPKTPSAKYHDDTTEGASEYASRTSIDGREDEYIENQRTHVRRHRRNISINSVSTTVRRSTPVTLRSRSTANGGLLELKANGARTQETTPSRAHRRNLSLKMPIRLSSPQSTDNQQALKRLSSLSTSSSYASPTNLPPAAQNAAELRYKQRHIFVGTASLSAFLGALETSPFGYTTRLSVMRAFTLLASKEQQLARQRSTSHEDWNLISRITPETSDFDNYTFLARVQLGSVSLQRFVDSIPFGERDEASLVVVVEAFKNAAHVDAQEESGNGGEALEFKRWLLGHGEDVEGGF